MMEINRLGGETPVTGRVNGSNEGGSRKAGKAEGGAQRPVSGLNGLFRKDDSAGAARAGNVERLRAEIAGGNYNPDPLQVARKILGME